MRVVVTSGYYKSYYAIAIIESLAKNNIEIAGCLNISTLNPKRIKLYWKQYRKDLLTKLKNKLFAVRNDTSNKKNEISIIIEYLKANNISSLTVKESAKKIGAKYTNRLNINNKASVEFVKSLNVDYIVYAGGGILKKRFINSAKKGVLNIHSGPLPHIRGMNACEWSLFYGLYPTVTIHYIDAGIDTGNVLKSYIVNVEKNDSIDSIRGKCAVKGIEGLVDVANMIKNKGHLVGTQQDKYDTPQYFVMCEELKQLVGLWLREGITPYCSFSDILPTNLQPAMEKRKQIDV